MEETPKVHTSRNRHHHLSNTNSSSSRRHQREQQRRNEAATVTVAVPSTAIAAVQLATTTISAVTASPITTDTLHRESNEEALTVVKNECTASIVAIGGDVDVADSTKSHSQTQSSQPTVLLVNGRLPTAQQNYDNNGDDGDNGDNDDNKSITATTRRDVVASAAIAAASTDGDGDEQQNIVESPTQPQTVSSRNSSGDAMSLRETLQQLPATTVSTHHYHHHRHRQQRRQPSPQTAAAAVIEVLDSSFHRELKQSATASPTPSMLSAGAIVGVSGSGGSTSGGCGVMRKLQSLSDPQASPAQRSIRSRSSLEKSPRRKRSKSESRRRRERKLIAAGEMEVRQANETLMRYLKQCSEMNDASLSGELEIDQNYDERRVHRKTKSQRDKRGHIIHKLYTTGGLSSILKELSDDIVPADGEEIYNPFTPVVSPTDDMPTHIDKMFLQTSSGYRPVERCYYKHPFAGNMAYMAGNASGTNSRNTNARGRSRIRGNGSGGCGTASHIAVNGDVGDDDDDDDGIGLDIEGRHYAGIGGSRDDIFVSSHINRNYCDTHYLLATEYERPAITTNIHLACIVQRIWHLISNISHGLIAGLALAHLILVMSSQPADWQAFHGQSNKLTITTTNVINRNVNVMNATTKNGTQPTTTTSSTYIPDETVTISHYAAFADVYLNSFYCLALLCLISVFDRMDISSWHLSAHATELISFRWLIIAMIYIVTIILTICSTTIDEEQYYSRNASAILTQSEVLAHSMRNFWNSLAVTRSIAAICGWLLIGATPQKDMLYEHLVDLSAYQLTNN